MSEPRLVTQVIEVGIGKTAALRCNSIDNEHNFLFWQLGQNDIIGPGNDYDVNKYKYQVLSGRLYIKGVTEKEAGYYRCISKNINNDRLNIGTIQVLVNDGRAESLTEDTSSDLEAVKIVFIILSLAVLIICGILFYRMRKERKRPVKLPAYVEDDDEGSGDEIYNRTTTLIDDSVPSPGPSTFKSHITGIDNRGLDDNFNANFEQIAINVANRNLV